MNSYAYADKFVDMHGGFEVRHAIPDVQSHFADVKRMRSSIRNRNSAGDHVGISNRLDFVHIILVNASIKEAKK